MSVATVVIFMERPSESVANDVDDADLGVVGAAVDGASRENRVLCISMQFVAPIMARAPLEKVRFSLCMVPRSPELKEDACMVEK